MKSAITGMLACLASIAALAAQDPPAEEPRQARGRVAHLVCTGVPEGLENPVQLMSGTAVTPLPLSKRAASEAVKIPADGILKLVREAADPADPAKRVFLTLARAVIPEEMGSALVILIPVAKKPDSDLVFRTEVQDLAAFTGGDYLYLNLTTMKVAVELGKDKLTLEPGQTRIFDAPELKESTNLATRYSFYSPAQKSWRMLSASTIVLRSTRREICIFSWDERLGRMDYHGITFPVTP